MSYPSLELGSSKFDRYLEREKVKRRDRIISHVLRRALGVALVGATALVASYDPYPEPHPFKINPTIVMGHGANGRPDEGLSAELKDLLEQKGFKVVAPQLPLGANQTSEIWQEALSKSIRRTKREVPVTPPIILIGVSGSVPVGLHVVEDSPVGAICGFYGIAGGIKGPTEKLYTGFRHPEAIKPKLRGNGLLLWGSNDTVINRASAEGLANQTGLHLDTDHTGAGHFVGLPQPHQTQKAGEIFRQVQAMAANC
jgi:pimeloyl-ACP methyl ester carboxylesterase